MKIPVRNAGKNMMFVGSKAVMPGETRHFHEHEVPAHLRPDAAPVPEPLPPSDPLDEISASGVRDVIAALPKLDTAQIERLGEMEQLKDKPRKSVLAMIAEELLKRAGNDGSSGEGDDGAEGDGEGNG